MKILKMRATFGKLQSAELALGEGLNVIEAPNEGGKSTWSAFLRAMLYGINTKERDRQGYLAEKNRYQPWSGAAMEGSVELLWQGRSVTLRRGPKGSTPFGRFEAVYTGTAELVPGLTGDNAGETLTGVPREVFERSAFVGQGGAAIDGAPALENEYTRLVTSGGNAAARAAVDRVFAPANSLWRGLGEIESSGLALRAEYAPFDAAARYALPLPAGTEPPGCRCGQVIRGVLRPEDCPLFGKLCRPEDPVGPCMVSGEGACAAAWKYRPADA